MTLIERAIGIALRAHDGQTDKNGEPYIMHPLRVMFSVMLRLPGDETAAAAAVLHDVIEDAQSLTERAHLATEFTLLQIPDDVVQLVGMLTRLFAEPYPTYIARVAEHPIARIIKTCDVLDNLSRPLPPGHANLRERYLRALEQLGGALGLAAAMVLRGGTCGG
jgi:(p)ppGpp synthase/HD superfamily hydrolase